MKIEMAFSLVTEVNTDDFDEAELLAKIKADAIIQGRVKTDEQGRIYLNTLKNL